MSDLISVIIPVYNVSSYLDECIKSITAQSYNNLEIILINDGSTDNSGEICEKWEQLDKRVKYINQHNHGVSVARNNGISSATGDWIAFIDADDWVEADYFKRMIIEAKRTNADEIICGFYTDFPNRRVSHSHFPRSTIFDNKEDISNIQIQIMAKKMSGLQPNSGDLVGAPWCKLFKGKFINDNKLLFVPGLKRSQDLVFNLYALEKVRKISYIDKPLYHYRIVENSACNNFSRTILDNVLAYLKEMDTFIKKYHRNDSRFNQAYSIKVCTSINKCLVQYFFNRQYQGNRKKMRAELNEFLTNPVFPASLKNAQYKHLRFDEMIFVTLLKFRMYLCLKMLVRFRSRFLRR